ncbi:hypothetical protein GS531_23065 [Rhodococcus hoagii]|nr:hypothetical protein [Prescottella equi]
MIPEAAREPLSNTLTVAAVGQTLMLTGSALARAVSHLPAHQLDTTSFATFYGHWRSAHVRRGGEPGDSRTPRSA